MGARVGERAAQLAGPGGRAMNPLLVVLLLRPAMLEAHLQQRWEERVAGLAPEAAAYHSSSLAVRGLMLMADREPGRSGEELRAAGGLGGAGAGLEAELRLRRRPGTGWEGEGRALLSWAGARLEVGALSGRLGGGLLGAGRYRWDREPDAAGAMAGYRASPRLRRFDPRRDELLLTLTGSGSAPLVFFLAPGEERGGLTFRTAGGGFSGVLMAGSGREGAELTVGEGSGRAGWRITTGAWREGGSLETVLSSRSGPLRLRLRGWRLWGRAAPGGAGPVGSGGKRDAGWDLSGALLPLRGWKVTCWLTSASGTGGVCRGTSGLRIQADMGDGVLLLRLRSRGDVEPAPWLPDRTVRRWDIDFRGIRAEGGGRRWQAGVRRCVRTVAGSRGVSSGLWVQLESIGREKGGYLRLDAALKTGAGALYSFEPGPAGTWRLYRTDRPGLRVVAGLFAAAGRLHLRLSRDEEGVGLRVVLGSSR